MLLKVDSGPGRNDRDLMLKVQFRGVYIYPSLPNATSVQQETDVSYRPFKNVVRDNLKRIALACFAKRKTIMKLGQLTFGLIVYGGICPLSGIACHNAVDKAFNVALNLKSWRQVGAVPFTKKCLENPKARHDRTDDPDPNFDVYQDIQSQNDFSVMQLNAMGYGGDVLRAQFLVDKICEWQAAAAPVTVAQTRERQEAIVAANTAGKCFLQRGEGRTLRRTMGSLLQR